MPKNPYNRYFLVSLCPLALDKSLMVTDAPRPSLLSFVEQLKTTYSQNKSRLIQVFDILFEIIPEVFFSYWRFPR